MAKVIGDSVTFTWDSGYSVSDDCFDRIMEWCRENTDDGELYIGKDYNSTIVEIRMDKLTAHKFDVRDFAKNVSKEFREFITVLWIPEKNALSDACGWSYDEFGYLREEHELVWQTV